MRNPASKLSNERNCGQYRNARPEACACLKKHIQASWHTKFVCCIKCGHGSYQSSNHSNQNTKRFSEFYGSRNTRIYPKTKRYTLFWITIAHTRRMMNG